VRYALGAPLRPLVVTNIYNDPVPPVTRNASTSKTSCLNSKFPPTLHTTLEIQPTAVFGEKCVRLYLLGYLSISVFATQNFRIKEHNENLF
jgi:hypothetical protein